MKQRDVGVPIAVEARRWLGYFMGYRVWWDALAMAGC